MCLFADIGSPSLHLSPSIARSELSSTEGKDTACSVNRCSVSLLDSVGAGSSDVHPVVFVMYLSCSSAIETDRGIKLWRWMIQQLIYGL